LCDVPQNKLHGNTPKGRSQPRARAQAGLHEFDGHHLPLVGFQGLGRTRAARSLPQRASSGAVAGVPAQPSTRKCPAARPKGGARLMHYHAELLTDRRLGVRALHAGVPCSRRGARPLGCSRTCRRCSSAPGGRRSHLGPRRERERERETHTRTQRSSDARHT